ncbi:MAG TPA: hypothetical protein VMM84_15695 [Pyrinomonadaceae bacterium]|nr:hypothetical protein [Pyrinomonadaceae bacterium]
MNSRTIILTVFVVATVLLLTSPSSNAQRRIPRRPPSAPGIDYSQFSHATEKHQASCDTCHKAPTRNWQKASQFPDIADYPDHEACVSCHRRQFFRGTRPVICTNCHVKVSPRADERFAFRKPTALRQFTIEFPHDKHQDVIARLFTAREPVLRRVSWLTRSQIRTSAYNTCAICHATNTIDPATREDGWPNGLRPAADTFKTVPTNHAACFNCHWQSQKPDASDCAGCHKRAAKTYRAANWPDRISLKFTHARPDHDKECTSCHINITGVASLRSLKPDVPIMSCADCHSKESTREDVQKELAQLDKNREFVCTYCHTANIGRLDPPAGHYLVAGREPLKRKEIK